MLFLRIFNRFQVNNETKYCFKVIFELLKRVWIRSIVIQHSTMLTSIQLSRCRIFWFYMQKVAKYRNFALSIALIARLVANTRLIIILYHRRFSRRDRDGKTGCRRDWFRVTSLSLPYLNPSFIAEAYREVTVRPHRRRYSRSIVAVCMSRCPDRQRRWLFARDSRFAIRSSRQQAVGLPF